jgi:hypothetical protein
MLRIVLCSEFDLRAELAASGIGRQGIDLYRARGLDEARVLATSLGAQLFLVDRDLPRALAFVQGVREDPATRSRSLAVLARGDLEPLEIELLEAGANAILRLPPDDSWAERLTRLLNVPQRMQARTAVELSIELPQHGPAVLADLSASGMRLECEAPLPLFGELAFRFRLPDGGAHVEGRARVVRHSPPDAWGLEFTELAERHRNALRDFQRAARLG